MFKLPKWPIFLLLVFLVAFFARPTFAESDQEKLANLNKQIQEYTAKISELQASAATLSNQIAQFNAKIHLTELKIDQTQEQINLLGGRIDQLEVSLDNLNKAFTSRVSETYKLTRVDESPVLLVTSPDISQAVEKYHYLEKIQAADQELLDRLATAKTTYTDQKTQLESLEKELASQKASLDAQKSAKANLLAVTKNDEKKYQQLLSEAQAQLSAFRRFVAGQGGVTILSNQTKCDGWGCYYNQRDAQWGNQLIGLSNSSMAEYGCLITSMAMMATHYGKNLTPGQIAASSSPFFGSTAYMIINQPWSVNGVTMNRTRIGSSTSAIDSELSAGRPVVVGIYKGPDHFLVIKAKEGSDYIMNDPFVENGGNVKFTDHYPLSAISTVDRVSVN